MVDCFIGIGSNLGDRIGFIKNAIDMLEGIRDIEVVEISPLYETKPVGGPPQGMFLNGVVKIRTALSPKELLRKLQEIENILGRERKVINGPRTIDLDILIYGDVHIEEEDLVIPHPRMYERDFVMMPLNDLLKGTSSNHKGFAKRIVIKEGFSK